jgi:serine/threonine protein kinase
MKQRSFIRSQSSTSSGGGGGSSRRRICFTTALDEVYQEIEIMKQLDSQNIIRLYEILNDPLSDKLYLVMPVADCGESLEWDEENN